MLRAQSVESADEEEEEETKDGGWWLAEQERRVAAGERGPVDRTYVQTIPPDSRWGSS
jgi:general transcription factor 3C polypeptide 5 (transcription factor C subunit 1)